MQYMITICFTAAAHLGKKGKGASSIISNTVPQDRTLQYLGKDRVDVIDVSCIIGEAIRRIHNGESISMLFEHGW